MKEYAFKFLLALWATVAFIYPVTVDLVQKNLRRIAANPDVCSTKWEENSYSGSFESTVDFVKENTLQPNQYHFFRPDALQYKFCFDYHTSGNRFGDFFNAVGCAHVAGLHLTISGSIWPLVPYLSALPRHIKHLSPSLSRKSAVLKVQQECQNCKYWCWENRDAPWMHALPAVRKYMHRAAIQHVKGYNSTQINPLTDISSAIPGEFLPVIPDVALQYRCGDNVEQDVDRYGFIRFHAISERIPASSKFIYILSDPPERSVIKAAVFNSKCKDIIRAFYQHIVTEFPNAIVIAKRGGDPFLDFARFTLSNTTVCSSSTFCLWPSLANRHTVYLPISLTMGGANRTSRPYLGSNIHYLEAPLIGNFTSMTPVSEILQILDSR